MSAPLLSRATPSDLEIRSDGRTVAGIVVPYGVQAMVSDGLAPYRESFAPGAFARSIAERGPARVKLLSQHNSRANPLGRATLLREEQRGLYGEFRISQTRDGDDALALLRDGALDAFSIGFDPVVPARHEWAEEIVRTEAKLREVSLVSFPAYADALVESVRSEQRPPAGLDRYDLSLPAPPPARERFRIHTPTIRKARTMPPISTPAAPNRATDEARASAYAQMQETVARAEQGGWTDQLRDEFDRHRQSFDDLSRGAIVAEQPLVRHEELSAIVAGGESANRADDPEMVRAFDAYLRTGDESLVRALGVATGSAGGFAVPQGFRAKVTESLKAFGGLRKLAEVVPTTDGANLPWPTNNDTANVGAILAENTQMTEQDVVLAQKTLYAYMYTSKMVRVSLQLLQDAGFDIDTWLARKLGERIGRAQAAHWITGVGTTEPQGILTGLTNGKTAAATTAVTYNELVDLYASVDPAYLEGEGVAWLMSASTLAFVSKIRDDSGGAGLGRPLVEPSVQAGTPLSILGHPIVVDNGMPAMTTGQKPIAFGNFRAAYVIRDVGDVQVLRLVERYADYLQHGFTGYQRADGQVQDSSAAKFLTMA
jgi:HK97 family phage major capsid protein/HK97 family phage prohead protease